MQERPEDASWDELMSLLEPVHDRIRRTARHLARDPAEGDDLFQEALLRAYHKLSGLRDPGRFRSWFYAVLLSVHRSRARRGFWRRFLSLEGERVRGFDPTAPVPADSQEERQRAKRVSRALATLPAVQREAVVLFELEDFSIEEISVMQKVSVSAVKSRLQRGRERLRRHYEHLGVVRPDRRESPAASDPRSAVRLRIAQALPPPAVLGATERPSRPYASREGEES